MGEVNPVTPEHRQAHRRQCRATTEFDGAEQDLQQRGCRIPDGDLMFGDELRPVPWIAGSRQGGEHDGAAGDEDPQQFWHGHVEIG
nr:hypothetical protein [Fodinicola feengrottensis]